MDNLCKKKIQIYFTFYYHENLSTKAGLHTAKKTKVFYIHGPTKFWCLGSLSRSRMGFIYGPNRCSFTAEQGLERRRRRTFMAEEENSRELNADCSFVWDEASQLYFHARYLSPLAILDAFFAVAIRALQREGLGWACDRSTGCRDSQRFRFDVETRHLFWRSLPLSLARLINLMIFWDELIRLLNWSSRLQGESNWFE